MITDPPDLDDESPTAPPKERPALRVVGREETADPRIEVKLSANTHEVTRQLIIALATDPNLFQRAGRLVGVYREDRTTGFDENGERAADAKAAVVAGTPKIGELAVSVLVDRVSERARCLRWNANASTWRHVEPPKARVQAVADMRSWKVRTKGTTHRIRPLSAVVEAPALRPDGSVLQKAGYDAATGYLFAPNAKFLPVTDKPTREDATRAYRALVEPFAQFPYVSPAHQAAAIAAILTLLARPAIRGSVPCWLFDASAPRSGKSLQVDVITTIATGRQASRTTYPDNDDELEKILAGYALGGAQIVNFDNVARKYGGASLDKLITATDTVDVRVLGTTGQVEVEWRGIIFASGNNVSCRGDMLARVLSPRLESPLDNPEQRDDLKKTDLRAWAREHRVRLHHAALTILRAFIVAGRPGAKETKWGGFEQWSALVPAAMRWAGAPDPIGARRGLDGDDDPDRAIARALVEGWERLHGPGSGYASLTIKQAIGELYPSRSRHDEDTPEDRRHDALKEAIEQATNAKPGYPPSTRALAELLRRNKDKVIGGKKLVRDGETHGSSRWKVIATS
jgi:hypothetical protein